MRTPPGSPEWLAAFTAAERPELWEQARDESVFDGVWPEYNKHGNHSGRYFGELFPRYAPLQILFTDRRSGGFAARGRTIPFRWDGSLADLPAGIDAVGLRAVGDPAAPTALSALAAPVRPSWKDRYPLTPIERYAQWTRDDGLPFDPWMRVHARLGAEILRAEPRSMELAAPRRDWEQWTGMAFPEDGDYVFPGGLAPLTVADGAAAYWEPNVWMRHPV
jgi:hypothetical protein